MDRKVRTAVVGCGAISDIYLTNMMKKYSTLEVVSCAAAHLESAQKKAKEYGIRACTYDEILADDSIELVVVLTPAPTHFELIRQALEAGKHVYTEKTLTDRLEDGKVLLDLAREKGLLLGAAPETFLGSCFQTARKAIDDGLIGEVTSFTVCANRNIDLLASIFTFLRMPGGGICYDYGVYYLTALVSLLGPVDRVAAVVENRKKVRTNIFPQSPEFGKEYTYDNESQVTAILKMESGVAGTLTLNGESLMKDLGVFTIYGTKGVLFLGDANQFGGEVQYIPEITGMEDMDRDNRRTLEPVSDLSDNCRGIGPAEMARAILRAGKAQGGETGKTAGKSPEMPRNRVDVTMAYHVLDTICQIMKSGGTDRMEHVESTCERPEAFTDWKELIAEKREGSC